MGAVERILDRSVLFSFDRSGYRRHAKRFAPHDLDRSMRDKTCLVTGANGGLGFEMARGLAERGASVHMLCRNAERGAEAQRKIARQTDNTTIHLQSVFGNSDAPHTAWASLQAMFRIMATRISASDELVWSS